MNRNPCLSQPPLTPRRGDPTNNTGLSRSPTSAVGDGPAGLRLKLLIVSEQIDMLEEFARVASDSFDVTRAGSVGVAMEMLTHHQFDLILADQNLHGMNGVTLLDWARRHFPRTIGTLLADHADLRHAHDALNCGWIYACVLRTAGAEEIIWVLSEAAARAIRWSSLEQVGQDCWQFRMNLARTDMERLLTQHVDMLRWHLFELEEENQRLRRQNLDLSCQVTTDQLTKLLNRGAIEAVAQAEITRRARHPGPLAIGLIDADHFKEINRQYLLPGGDQALIGLAAALTGSLRATDRLGRISGEEFMVVAPQTDVAGATALAERLRAAVEQHSMFYHGKQIKVTVSTGFAVVEEGTVAHLDLLRHRAADALNEAKRMRNCSVIRTVGFAQH